MRRALTEFYSHDAPGLGLNFTKHVQKGVLPEAVSSIKPAISSRLTYQIKANIIYVPDV